MWLKKMLRFLYRFITFKINFKTLYFNFHYFPAAIAIECPILISNNLFLKEMAGSIRIESDSVFFGMIHIGYGDVGIFDAKGSRSIWEVTGTVIFKGRADIGHGSKLSVSKTGTLIFGENFCITAQSSIIATTEIRFGNNCLVSWDVLIMDTDFHPIKDKIGTVLNASQPILIGDKVWIGCRNLILKGSVIPNNAIIGAGSILSKQLDTENAIYAGNPIKKIKEDVYW
jgi:carbonic anhydrase/acetyltransferase-like protein (isoleucine patch superfamily)